MTTVIGPETETYHASDTHIENQIQFVPPFLRSVGDMAARVAGRTILPVAGAAMGAYLALHGTQYSTDIEGTQVTVSTDLTTHQTGIHTEVIIEDPPLKPQSLGGVNFPDFLKPLPLSIKATAYPGSTQVTQTITGRYDYINKVMTEAKTKAYDAVEYFLGRLAIDAGSGIIAGVAISEGIAAGRRNIKKPGLMPAERHPALKGLGHSGLALAFIAAGGAYMAHDTQPNLGYHPGYGAIGDAMKTPQEITNVNLKSPVLDQIFKKFREQNRCPESKAPAEQPAGSLTFTTYNVRSGTFTDQGVNGISQELANTKSDVIFLQEATPEVVNQLANDLGMRAITGWTIQNKKLTFGNAILTDLQVKYTEYIPLPTHGEEPRGVLAVELLSPDNGQPFIVADTHLSQEKLTRTGDARAYIRADEAHTALDRLLKVRQGDEAVILAGDFNDKVDGPAYDIMTSKLDDMIADQLEGQSTFPANGLRFDNVFMNKGSGWKTIAAARGGGDMSDHCAVTWVAGMDRRYVTPEEAAKLADPAAIPSTAPSTEPH